MSLNGYSLTKHEHHTVHLIYNIVEKVTEFELGVCLMQKCTWPFNKHLNLKALLKLLIIHPGRSRNFLSVNHYKFAGLCTVGLSIKKTFAWLCLVGLSLKQDSCILLSLEWSCGIQMYPYLTKHYPSGTG
jgi:hypothetical protein